jgi:hypothetical protein
MDREQISISLVAGFSLLLAWASIAVAVEHPPDVSLANFDPNQAIDNPYFPMPTGRLLIYEGTTEGVPTHDEVCVIGQTGKMIEDVLITEVHHRSFERVNNQLVLVEDTKDWFAQDIFGTVWYLGEDTLECPCPPEPGGNPTGSWESGVDNADGGFIMLADPQVGVRYYQEFARKVAEDQAKVLSLEGSACVEYPAGPATTCYDGNLLVTKETSQLDPGVVELKYYAPNVGFILAEIVKGGDERTELVSITDNSGCN